MLLSVKVSELEHLLILSNAVSNNTFPVAIAGPGIDMKTTGQRIVKGNLSCMPEVSEDDPISMIAPAED